MQERWLLALLATPKIGRKTAAWLLQNMPEEPLDTRSLLDLLAWGSTRRPGIRIPSPEEVAAAFERADLLLDAADRLEIHAIPQGSNLFPGRLRAIDDPPVVLFVLGNQECLIEKPAVAVIGTREPSEYGAQTAKRFGKTFAELGFTVVSGLAIGCDSAAHEGCLEVHGQTVAVLAHGLDSIYPAINRSLAERIVASGGCLVSEYPPGLRAQRSFFIERDRLQSGLSNGIVVVETDIKGGTMHTVGFAHEQGRPVAALVHPQKYARHEKTKGNRHLIEANRAYPIADKSELEHFAGKLRDEALRCCSECPTRISDRPQDQMSLFDGI